jgi:hypothetical protein
MALRASQPCAGEWMNLALFLDELGNSMLSLAFVSNKSMSSANLLRLPQM